MSRLAWLQARWSAMGRSQREGMLALLAALVVAAVLGGLTTHETVGWRQTTGFALVIVFYAVFALGLSLEFGHAGLLNLGHVAFMAIGAYTYGVLMMEAGRPDGAAPVVGWLFDASARFAGATTWGLVACGFVGLVVALLLLVPLSLGLEDVTRTGRPTLRRAALPAGLLAGGALVVAGALSVEAGGKPALVAGLLLGALFTGFVAALAGAILLTREALAAIVAPSPLARSRRGRLVLAAGLSGAAGLVAAVSAYPLGEDGAVAVGVLMAVVIGMALAALVALLLGSPAIRLREDYLAIVTLGFAEILRSVILNEERWTRGAQPIQSFPRPVAEWASDTPWWREIASSAGVRAGDLALLVVSVLVLAYVYVLLRALAASPWGRVLRAIREDEDAAAALGKPVTWFKLQALMLGSAIAAVAGVLFVSQTAIVAHQQFLPIVTFYAFIVIVLGGVGNHKGALVGAVILWGIFFGAQNAGLEAFGIEAGPAQLIVVGVVLIVVMMFRPQGLVGRKEELLFAK